MCPSGWPSVEISLAYAAPGLDDFMANPSKLFAIETHLGLSQRGIAFAYVPNKTVLRIVL